jgi:hypothetical protein
MESPHSSSSSSSSEETALLQLPLFNLLRASPDDYIMSRFSSFYKVQLLFSVFQTHDSQRGVSVDLLFFFSLTQCGKAGGTNGMDMTNAVLTS